MLLVALLVVLSLLVRRGLEAVRLPALAGFMLLGFALHGLEGVDGLFDERVHEVLEFLGHVGVMALLFKVGLESRLRALVKQLRRASEIWLGDVVLSTVTAGVATHLLLGAGALPSLFVAVALAATSVGVSVSVWERQGALGTPRGQLLVDVAELDDISSILLMTLLFALAPTLRSHGSVEAGEVVTTLEHLALRMGLYAALCGLFVWLVAPRVIRHFHRHGGAGPLLLLVASGFSLAALAGLLGLSVAIGAFLSGVILGRGEDADRIVEAFEPLYEIAAPFFFISIGLAVDPSALLHAGPAVLVLLAAAAVGKVVGAGGSAVPVLGWSGGALLGVSMIPRAEIALLVMQRGQQLGDWAVPERLFAAVAVVALASSLLAPIAVARVLDRTSHDSG
jgi:Kef-type K+ transport system membrane component KefB